MDKAFIFWERGTWRNNKKRGEVVKRGYERQGSKWPKNDMKCPKITLMIYKCGFKVICMISSWNCLLPPKDFNLQIYSFWENYEPRHTPRKATTPSHGLRRLQPTSWTHPSCHPWRPYYRRYLSSYLVPK